MSRTKRKSMKQRVHEDLATDVRGAKAGDFVTAPVTTAIPAGATKAEIAAFHLLGKSEHFVVGTNEQHTKASTSAFEFGRMVGKMNGLRRGLTMPRTAGEQRALDQAPALGKILSEVFREVKSAVSKHGPMHSGHEGFAVIKEEVDELWDEIKADRGRQSSARTEAIQIAAMAVRYALDVDPR